MTIKISKSTAGRVDGGSNQHLIVAMAQQIARQVTAAETDITDSSGGTASTTLTLVDIAADFANVADNSTSLASGTTAAAKLNLVKDAILELATKANALATKIGVTGLTYNGGGTSADGTIGAIGTTTAATTGAKATESNATVLLLNDALFSVAALVNRLAVATGVAPLKVDLTGTFASTVASITVATGTAADPGISKTAFDAKLALYANNIATVAARLNALTAAFVPDVVVVE